MRLIWSIGLMALAVFAGLGVMLAPLQPNILALQLAFTPSDFQSVLGQWGPDGVALYRSHFPADFALLALYGAFGWLLATRAGFSRGLSPQGRRWMAAMLPLAAGFDALENVLHLWLTAPAALAASPQGGLIVLAAACASAKWLLLMAFAVSVAQTLWRARRSARP